jgi:hypothetical protein
VKILGALLYVAAALMLMAIAAKFAAADEIDWLLACAAVLVLPMAALLWRRGWRRSGLPAAASRAASEKR